MASLYHRATPSQARILRAVEGAVKNASDAHPKYAVPQHMRKSIAKRAAGTLSAQWLTVLAAHSVPSESAAESGNPPPGRPALSAASRVTGRRASHLGSRRSPLPALWKRLAFMAGQARRDGQTARADAMVDMLKLVASMQKERT
jgi:hypothetical protein